MKNLLATALLVASLEAAAGNISHGTFSGNVEFAKVTEVVSVAGETQEQFLVRVAREMRSLTAENGYEYCGRLGMNDNGFAIVVTTNYSHVGCLVTNDTVAGYSPTPLHIHSHPHGNSIRVNKNDRVFLGKRNVPLNSRYSVHSETFSPTDFAGSPGYLVTETALLYQYGPGKVRVIANL